MSFRIEALQESFRDNWERVAEIKEEVKVWLDAPEAANAMAAPVTRYLASETGTGALGGQVDGYLASTEGKAFLRGRVNSYLAEEAGQAALAGRVTDYLKSDSGREVVSRLVSGQASTHFGTLAGDQIKPFTDNKDFMRKLAQNVVEFMP